MTWPAVGTQGTNREGGNKELWMDVNQMSSKKVLKSVVESPVLE